MTGWSPRRSSSGSPGAIFFIFFFPLARFSQLALSLGRTWTFDVPLSSLTRSHIFAFNDSSFKIYKKRNKKNSKPEELVHKEAASSANVPLLRRFSGGGTVLLGPGCVWATLVGGEEHLPGDVAGRGPRPLMEWTERVWAPVFGRIGDFKLREHGTSFFFFFFFHHQERRPRIKKTFYFFHLSISILSPPPSPPRWRSPSQHAHKKNATK